MTGPPTGALERALLQLAVGNQRASIAHQLDRASKSGGDMLQHVKVIVKGKVGKAPLDFDLKVEFPLPILFAPNRGNTMTEPHMNYGIEVVANTSETNKARPTIEPHLLKWETNDSVWYTGAHIRVRAYIPFAPKPMSFKALIHLTFFGWAAPPDEPEQNNDA